MSCEYGDYSCEADLVTDNADYSAEQASEEEVIEAMEASQVYTPKSLDLTYDASGDDKDIQLQDIIGRDDKYFDIIVMLQPTSPLRSFSEVMQCIRLVAEGASAAWAVSKLDVKYHYKKQLLASEEGILRVAVPGPQVIARQELKDTYIRNGACYAISRKTLIEDPLLMGSNCGYVVSESARPNIDEEWDLQLAEQISFVNQGYLGLMSKINT